MTTDLDRALALLDEILANNQRSIDNLRAILDPPTQKGEPTREPLATADTMTEGGWVRFPGSLRWRKIAQVTKCHATCRRIDFDTFAGDRDGTYVHVDPFTTYPFLTAEQFDRDCRQEQEDEAADRLQRAEWLEDGAA